MPDLAHYFQRAIKCRVRHAAAHSHAPLPCSFSPLPLPFPRRSLCHHAATPPFILGLPRRPRAPLRYLLRRDRSDNVRLGLGTFETTHEAVHAYDAAAWRLGRPHAQMNFHDVYKREQVQNLAPPPHLITEQDRQEHRRQQRRLLVAEEDERAMEERRQRHPEDVAAENAYSAKRTARHRAERQDKRQRKLLAVSQCWAVQSSLPSIFTSVDERWEDAFLSTSDNTQSDDSE
ncbi:Protein TRANSPARENT TESTA 12 [Hordeum vulgare]|nr:Protein TRANSPARENT TESTA 12 [Hordeum vulgare]